MSINDLLDSDVVIPAILVIFVLVMIFAVPAGWNTAKKTNNIYGDNGDGAAKEEKNAEIVATRTTVHPLNYTVMINTVVFQFANGSRIELAIKDPNIFGTMIEGDRGTLKYQEKKFISFERDKSSET